MKRSKTDLIVVHCSATFADMDVGVKEIRKWHKKRGWSDVGYHKVIRRDGTVEDGRDMADVGAHVKGKNKTSVGICMVGGVDQRGEAAANFTTLQYRALKVLLDELQEKYPKAKVCGHRDLSPDKNKDGKVTKDEWLKDCPSFDVADFMG